MNVTLPPAVWVDLYAATGITPGNKLAIINITPNDARVVNSVSEPNGLSSHIPVLFRGSCVVGDVGDPGAWGMCVGGGAIDVADQGA